MTWSCPQCTLINHDSIRACEACGSEKRILNLGSLLPRSVEQNLNNIANAVAEILTPPCKAPKPVAPSYNINALPSPSTLPPSPSRPPRPPPPAGLARSSRDSKGGVRFAGPSSSNSPNSHRYIERNLDESWTTRSLTIRDKERKDENTAGTIFKNIMDTCRAINEPFIDPDFAHNASSVGKFLQSGDVVNGDMAKMQIQDLVWLRPSQIFTKDGRRWVWAVFRDPRPSDIEQGVLGDCWLLSAMALVAERPDILEQVVLTKEYNPVGVYQIRICVDGEWKVITLDDFLPCRPRSKSLAFATGRKNQLWVPLIEKALAKELGSYERLRAGRTIEGLSMLTGASCETISLEEGGCADTTWARLLSAREAGFVMGCSCGAGSRAANDEEYKQKGLLTRHAYSILDVRQEGPHRLLRLRNPWGSFVWQGTWSDRWTGWPAGLRARLLDGVEPESGTFWISFTDFIAHFDSVDIARVRSGGGAGQTWAEMRVPVKLGGSFSNEDRSLRLVVETNTEVSMSVFQSGARTRQDQVDLLLCVHEVTASGHVGELVARSPRTIANFVSTGEIFLRPGQYIVVCHSLNSIGHAREKLPGTLVVHSNRPVYGDQLLSPPQMYTDSIVNVVLKEGKQVSSVDGCLPRYLTKDFGGLIMMIDNYHEKLYVQTRLNCSRSENVTSSRRCMTVSDSIPPLHRQIVMVLSHFEPSQSYSVVHEVSMRMSRRPGLDDWCLESGDRNVFHAPMFENRDMAVLHEYKPLFF